MMTPVQNAWAVVATPVRERPDPPLTPKKRQALRAELTTAVDDGQVVKLDPSMALSILNSADTSFGPVVDYEVTIVDDERGVQYAARVNDRGDLSRLVVTIDGQWIDDNVLRRVPVARIRRTALEYVAKAQRAGTEGEGESIVLTFAGGLAERPPLEEIARLMGEGRTRAEIHAIFPRVPLPTLGRWMGTVRKQQKNPDTDRVPVLRKEKS